MGAIGAAAGNYQRHTQRATGPWTLPLPRPTPRPASDLFPTLSLCVGMQGLARPLLARAGTSIPRKSPQGFVPQFALEIASLPRTLLGSPSLADKGSRLTGQSGPGGVAQATAPKEE